MCNIIDKRWTNWKQKTEKKEKGKIKGKKLLSNLNNSYEKI